MADFFEGSTIDLSALLPHAGDMCLLESIHDWDRQQIRCLANSHRNKLNPLRRNGKLAVIAGVEYAAQAMAVHNSLRDGLLGEPQVGYIAVLTKVMWDVQWLDEIAAPLEVQADRLAGIEGGCSYLFNVKCGEKSLIRGEIMVALA